MTQQTILVIDDSKAFRTHTCGVLDACGRDYRTIGAENGLEGFKTLVSTAVDLVLCDITMPVLDGFKFLRAVRTRADLQDIPIIIVAGGDDVADKVAALEGGATDYLTKPFHEAELVARVGIHLHVRELQQELLLKNQQLERTANTDPLTGIANRRHLFEMLEIELLRAEGAGTSLATVMLDIDHFKNINDTFGHLVGDRVLRALAEVLTRGLREHDVAARFGGEEFVLLLPETNLDGARIVAERYRHKVQALRIIGRTATSSLGVDALSMGGRLTARRIDESLPPFSLRERSNAAVELASEVAVTASFGAAVSSPERRMSAEALLRKADQALYRAKDAGRNRTSLASVPSGA